MTHFNTRCSSPFGHVPRCPMQNHKQLGFFIGKNHPVQSSKEQTTRTKQVPTWDLVVINHRKSKPAFGFGWNAAIHKGSWFLYIVYVHVYAYVCKCVGICICTCIVDTEKKHVQLRREKNIPWSIWVSYIYIYLQLVLFRRQMKHQHSLFRHLHGGLCQRRPAQILQTALKTFAWNHRRRTGPKE